MKLLRYLLYFCGLLALEAVICVLLPRIHSGGFSLSSCMWIAFYIPLAMVFLVFSALAFRDGPRRGIPRVVDAVAGGFLASLLWAGIVFIVGVKLTGAGTLVRVEENAQDGAANRSQPVHSETNTTSSAAGSRR
jgi:hypothetical protein